MIVTTAVIKGGTGKTTTAAALAQAAASDERKVLAIDLDPQANLTLALRADATHAGSFQLLNGAAVSATIQPTEQRIDVIAAHPDLATVRTSPGSALRLRDALEPIKSEYDLIVIDTPPTMGELTFNALFASTGLIIPLEADLTSIQGFCKIAEIARQIQTKSPELSIIGTVVTRYDPRPKINRHIQSLIERQAESLGIPYLREIRTGIAVREAQALQQSLFRYAPTSKPAKDYKELYREIMEV